MINNFIKRNTMLLDIDRFYIVGTPTMVTHSFAFCTFPNFIKMAGNQRTSTTEMFKERSQISHRKQDYHLGKKHTQVRVPVYIYTVVNHSIEII